MLVLHPAIHATGEGDRRLNRRMNSHSRRQDVVATVGDCEGSIASQASMA